MSHSSFCNIPLILKGEPNPVQDAVAEMFALNQPVSGENPVTLLSFAVAPEEPLTMLPDEARTKLEQLSPSPEAIMIHCSQGDTLAATVQHNCLSCAWLSADGCEIRFVARKKDTDKTGLSVGGCLIAILRELIDRRGMSLIHGAALRCPDGTGMLLNADGGGGKSTTSLATVRNGAMMLADDLIALSESAPNSFMMTGFPELMNLTEQTLRFFPELERGVQTDSGNLGVDGPFHRKRKINPVKAYEGWSWLEQTRLNTCLYIEISPNGPSVQALTAHDFFGRLLRSHTFARNQKLSRCSADLLLTISSTIPAYILYTGSNPSELGTWLVDNSRRLAKRELPSTVAPREAGK